MELMNYFAANIGNTSWFDILQSYFEIDFYGNQISIDAQTSFGGNISLLPSAQKLTLTDLDFVKLILSLQNDPVFVSTDTTCVYTIMFRGDFNVSVNGKSWLTDWCSYHGAFAYNGGIVKYSVVGDPSTAPGTSGEVCEPVRGRNTANGDLGADSMAVGFAQQLANSITDFEGAWYSDRTGLEVSSSCNGDFGSGVYLTGPQAVNSNIAVGDKSFLVQSLWQPQVGCRMTPY